MDNQKIAEFQKQLLFLIEKHQEVHSQYEKNPENSSLGEQLVHIQSVILFVDRQQKMVLDKLRTKSLDTAPCQSSTSCPFSSLPNSPDTQSPSTSSGSCSKNKSYHPEYSFITEENSYLLQDAPLDSDEESSYFSSERSSRSGSVKRSGGVIEESEDPRDVATQNEFLLSFGMLPKEHLSDLLTKRQTKYKEKRNKLFFAPGPAELRKKKSLQKKTNTLPVNLAQENENASDEGMEITCGVCGAIGAPNSVSQCGGCGYTAHPTCNPPTHSLGVRCPGDPWLCAHCNSKGIRADIRHDPLLLRNLSLSKVPRARAPVVRKEKKKRGFALRNYRANQTSSQTSSSSLPPPPPPPSSPHPILSSPVPPPKKIAKIAQNNTIKTRGRANRRPPSKYLNSPDIDSRDTSKHSTGRLTLTTKSVKISRADTKTIRDTSKPPGHPVSRLGGSRGSNTIQLSTYNKLNDEITRVNKSLTINFAAKSDSVKNLNKKHVDKRQNLMKVFSRILTESA